MTNTFGLDTIDRPCLSSLAPAYRTSHLFDMSLSRALLPASSLQWRLIIQTQSIIHLLLASRNWGPNQHLNALYGIKR